MKKNRNWSAGAAALGMVLLILDGQAAARAAADGISLCLQAVIPSLLPFFFVSILLTGNLSPQGASHSTFLAKLFAISPSAVPLLITGFLGGYPIGAQNTAAALAKKQLSPDLAHRMIRFINQPGPAFLFGMVGPQFSSPSYPWMIWTVLLLSAWFVSAGSPQARAENSSNMMEKAVTASEALMNALRAMGNVCGWVILFRVILGFLQRWILWTLPLPLRILISGCLELTNGCTMLSLIAQEELRFIIACILLSFGGICVMMQTQSVIHPMHMGPYLAGKLLQTLFTAGLSSAWMILGSKIGNGYAAALILILTVLAGTLVISRRNRKITVAFSQNV